MKKPFLIAVDFDGTIVQHNFPDIGKLVPDSIYWMLAWRGLGAEIALWTMRSGKYLDQAVQFCWERGLTFNYVNVNLAQVSWTQSPKLYANVYIDDAAIGCPLIYGSRRPYVDWSKIGMVISDMIRQHNRTSRTQ